MLAIGQCHILKCFNWQYFEITWRQLNLNKRFACHTIRIVGRATQNNWTKETKMKIGLLRHSASNLLSHKAIESVAERMWRGRRRKVCIKIEGGRGAGSSLPVWTRAWPQVTWYKKARRFYMNAFSMRRMKTIIEVNDPKRFVRCPRATPSLPVLWSSASMLNYASEMGTLGFLKLCFVRFLFYSNFTLLSVQGFSWSSEDIRHG